MTVFLTLPAYNEGESLPGLLTAFQSTMREAGFEHRLVICDDGSSDRTREVIDEWRKQMPVELVAHPANRGLGETIRDALERASELAGDEDVIVTMDADNTHSPSIIPAMIGKLNEGAFVVIASRYRSGSRVVGLNLFRHVMSWGARALFQVVFPIRGVRDYTCSFRCYRPAIVRQAFRVYGKGLVSERGFSCMAEILLRLAKLQAPMCELPMVLRYDLKGGPSKMSVWHTVLTTLKLMVRLRFS